MGAKEFRTSRGACSVGFGVAFVVAPAMGDPPSSAIPVLSAPAARASEPKAALSIRSNYDRNGPNSGNGADVVVFRFARRRRVGLCGYSDLQRPVRP